MLLEICEFTEENIIEPLMNFYKDFDYVNYILNSKFDIGYKLFYQMKIREINILEEKQNNRYWQLFIKSKTELSFSEFVNQIKKEAETKNMSDEDKDNEEQRIIEKFENPDLSKYRKV